MEPKLKGKSNTDPAHKSKKQIEAEYPIIKPSECPGAVIDWVVKRDAKRDEALKERDEELVRIIGDTIDKLFEKHFRKYITMIFTNRILIIVFSLLLSALWGVVLFHIYK